MGLVGCTRYILLTGKGKDTSEAHVILEEGGKTIKVFLNQRNTTQDG
jgi:hypothetical protein